MKALIVDDDRTLADLLAFTLRRAGFEPFIANDAPSAVNLFNQVPVDVIVLDINIPGAPGLKDGFDVCRRIRKNSEVPIILLTVRDDEEDILRGLDDGADDYVQKPFSPRQLVARIKAVLRRSDSARLQNLAPYYHDDTMFDPHLRVFIREGHEPVSLTKLESRLLDYFMLNTGQVLPAEMVIDHVWGPGGGNAEMLRQLVRRLRKKVELSPDDPVLIHNRPGVGYGFAVN